MAARMFGGLLLAAVVLLWISAQDLVDGSPNGQVLGGLLGAYGLTLGLYAVTLVSIRRAVRRAASSSFSVAVLRLVGTLQNAGDGWADLSFLPTVLKQIEDCARSIERNARALNSGDRETDAEILLHHHQIGAFIRSLKQWVLFPTDLTYCDLMHQLNQIAYAACSEKWDSYRGSPQGPRSRRRGITPSPGPR